MFFFFAKDKPKPVEYRIVYDFKEDICLEYGYKYMFTPISKKDSCFSPYIRKISKVNGNKYEGMSLPHDTNANWRMFGKNLVLTIDDSYDFEQTKQMLQVLKRYNITATFFPNTIFINPNNEEHVKLWRYIYNSGHEIGYHTTDHNKKKSVKELNSDFAKFTKVFRKILDDRNFSIKVVRAPYGYFDNVWMKWMKENNLFNVRWTITEGEDSIYLKELYAKDRGTVLLIHNKKADVQWLTKNIDSLIEIAKENGGKLGSIYDSIIRM